MMFWSVFIDVWIKVCCRPWLKSVVWLIVNIGNCWESVIDGNLLRILIKKKFWICTKVLTESSILQCFTLNIRKTLNRTSTCDGPITTRVYHDGKSYLCLEKRNHLHAYMMWCHIIKFDITYSCLYDMKKIWFG